MERYNEIMAAVKILESARRQITADDGVNAPAWDYVNHAVRSLIGAAPPWCRAERMTQQPKWRHVATIGDVDPIAYGGGFVYVDTTGVYPPEMTWVEPASDDEWKEKGEGAVATIYRFILEADATKEWWYDELEKVSESFGCDLMEASKSSDPKEKGFLYSCLVGYYGPGEFDQYPLEMPEVEAYQRYKQEMSTPQIVGE